MSRWIVAGLIVLNLLLGAGVYLKLVESKAQAQIGKPSVEVETVSGNSNGSSVVYILDVYTGDLVAMKNDVINNALTVIAKKNVAGDITRVR